MITETLTPRKSSATSRITAVSKLHLVNPWATIIMPWLILAAIFAGMIGVWLLIHALAGPQGAIDAHEGMQWSGAINFVFVYMMVISVQAISVTFPFALGFGVTRRDFYLGSALTFVGLAAMWSVGLTILAQVETATSGWGLGGVMFTPAWAGDVWYQRLFIFFAAGLFFFFLGSIFAAIWVRWKATGLTTSLIALAFLVLGGVALLTLTESWPAFGNFFVVSGLTGTFAWSLLLSALSGVTGFFILRRATPKS